MPTPVLTATSTVLCMHGGTALPTAPFPRVTAMGQPVITQVCTYTIAGCSLASIPSPPCVTGTWVVGATRVMAGGAPLVLVSSTAVCAASGQGLIATPSQTRVLAT